MLCWQKRAHPRSKSPMSNELSALAPAKINLTLHITGQRDDGYHLLDSLVVFADIGDRISAAPADELTLNVTGPFAGGIPTDDSNLMLRAAKLLLPDHGAALTLEKHLPPASGIGGGSSDAAATLRLLSDLWDVAMPKDVLALGADMPVCMTPCAQRMSGIGELLSKVPALPACDIVLVNPRVEVSTPAIFKSLQERNNPPMPAKLPAWANVQDFAEWLGTQRNDMQTTAEVLQPAITDVLVALQATDTLFSRMSGSGATCFALFPPDGRAAKNAQKALQAAHPEWWVAEGSLLS
ncbi:4-diphosphocytidyl-2-C-methyl-D-erythritol kinase [Cognatishimia maritima]|uniref:4-diphosphocytidyl-2-C-methyl-D-erythritol kinase n=2 Tax=Cognatishimia maritima TaxID=870908 RepID=A0A1M5RS48_9RHOB|nr:4-diphosphocytidyl-2-C-methyl-D-erythritol kinase [Cognatishimia maritima]